MDDEVIGGWKIDEDTRLALRLESVKKALDEEDWSNAVIEAEELLDEAPDHVEGLYLLAEALLELGDAEGANETFERHLEVAREQEVELDPGHLAAVLCGLAVARFECVDMPAAAEAAREAIRLAPDLAQAHYYLGLALERMQGRKSESTQSILAAHRLDPEAYPLPLLLHRAQWEAAFGSALEVVHPRLQAFWSGLPVHFHELPDLAELRRHEPPLSPTVSGLYEGEPPENVKDPWQSRPKSLRLYTANLARLGHLDRMSEEIARTLQDEALDWLGLTLEDLD
jgi:tetratricopeptide (TPR) repeat protein